MASRNGGDFYGLPTSNSLHLMNRYFTAYPEDATKVVFCLKTGIVDLRTFSLDTSPAHMRSAAENALKILDGKKSIDVFGPCRVDPNVPIEDTIAECAKLKAEGLIGGIALSEVSADTIRRAAKVAKIDMVEAEVSLWSTDIFSNGVADACAELGIIVTAHTPLGAGMLTGAIRSPDDLSDFHRMFPRFQPAVFDKNLELVDEVGKLAQKKGCTSAQLALAWVKIKGKDGKPFVVHVAGARSVERVKENSADVELDAGDLKKIEEILASFPLEGARSPGFLAKHLEY